MKLTDISCTNCNNTTAFEHSHNLVECTSCSTMIHMDTPVFHTYEVEPLHDIMEQRAKDKAVIDMQLANMPFIDWSTCFDTDNITNNNICDCTAPQVDEDKMCICGLPITIQTDWTNDSGYSDVFH